jgi:alpha-L-fucosidase
LANGGKVLAACIAPDGRLGMLALKDMPGLTPIGWKIVSVSSESPEHPAVNAIDGKPNTFWETGANAMPEQQITVDMGGVHRVSGFTYLPRQDRDHAGVVERYRFETSADGRTWSTAIASGRFENISNNPELQKVFFPSSDARFFRLTALQDTQSADRASAAQPPRRRLAKNDTAVKLWRYSSDLATALPILCSLMSAFTLTATCQQCGIYPSESVYGHPVSPPKKTPTPIR